MVVKQPSVKVAPDVPGFEPRIPQDQPWDLSKHVLTTKSFPATSILRVKFRSKGTHTCACSDDESHRDYFSFSRNIVGPKLRSGSIVPNIKVCWNAENIWECKLPTVLTGLSKRVDFDALPSIWHAQKVLYEGTYWFRRLIAPDSNGNKGRNGVAVLRRLAGLPSYSGKERVDQLVKMKISKSSIHRLRSILATVDGLVMQLVLCFPMSGDYLSWDRIDQIIHCMICNLLPDYFRERNSDLTRMSVFEKIKRLRKAIKYEGFRPNGNLSSIDVPREMSFFKVLLDFINERKTPFSMFQVSTLGQTRAAGVPPQSVYFKTLLKIKAILQEPPNDEVYNLVESHLKLGADLLHISVMDSIGSESNTERFYRSCLDKAKISLSDSGEFFTNSESGGKLEACRKVLNDHPVIPEINLENGQLTGNLLDRTNSNVGEMIFHWACGEFRDRNRCYEKNLMSVRISLVAELGKYRGITVSHLAHAVLLHVLSHVLLEYIRVIPSSESGVGAANHAWNFFKRLSHKNPSANFLFGDKEVYLFSTDWEQATDFCDHKVAQVLINRMCFNLGIPNWYRQTCVFALCAPRQVEFMNEDKILDCFFTTRGELMGDPVVKVILHCYHLVARLAAMQEVRLSG